MPNDDMVTRTRPPKVTSDVTEVLDKVSDVIKGVAAKNATMKDGAPDGGGGGGDRPPTPTEERVGAYEKYKDAVGEAFDKNTNADGTIDKVGLSLDVAQAVADLGVAVGPEVAQVMGDFIGKLIPK